MDVPLRGDCYKRDCPSRAVLDHVTGRWGALVLAALLPGTLRFSELRTRVSGISEKMLAQTLREFEADGFVKRTQYQQVPPRVDYTLTPSGVEIAKRLDHLIDWIEVHLRDFVRLRDLTS